MPILFQIILFLFFTGFAWLSNKNTKAGIYAIIFLLPAYLIRFSLFGIPTTALEIMIYILFAAWFLKNKDNFRISEGVINFYKTDKILFWGIALLFLGVILSTSHSVNLRASLGILKGWFFDPFLFFIILASEAKDSWHKINIMFSLALSGFVVAAIGLFYALCGVLTFDGRLRAFYESPNYLAMYLVPGFLLAVYLFVFEIQTVACHCERSVAERGNPNTKRNNRYIRYREYCSGIASSPNALLAMTGGVLFCYMAALFLTKSYGTFLGIAAALVFLMARKYKKISLGKNTKRKIYIFSLIAFLAFSFVSYQKYLQVISSNERSSFHSRLMIWNASREMLEDSPFFGIGPGTFQEVYLDYQSRFSVPYLEWAVAEPHNTFLAFYLQSGIIGFIGFFLILLWLYKKSKTNDVIFLFFIYFLIHGLVDTLYWKNDLSVIFWMIMASGIISQDRKSKG